MSKTTEQAANEYAANWEEKHNIHNPELYGLIVDAYKASAERIMYLPLASRLTAEEKETFREMYGELRRKWWVTKDKYAEADALDKIERMETIFGADFFKEGE